MSRLRSDRDGDSEFADVATAQALARAREHARRALAEALAACGALLDAASLAATGAEASRHPLFAAAAAWLLDTRRNLARGAGPGEELGAALSEALEAEIARWERRARNEVEARAVLRAFLGLRELLWELGVRPASEPERGATRRSGPDRSTPPRGTRRSVERVAVVQG